MNDAINVQTLFFSVDDLCQLEPMKSLLELVDDFVALFLCRAEEEM